MELVFQEYELTGLERICSQSFIGEQTADVIIPDSYPDVERIVDAFGTVLVEDAQCLPGGVSITGTVQGGVVFLGENEEPRTLSVRIPFTLRKELQIDGEDNILSYRCELRSVDARAVNSRKLLVRVGLRWGFELYRPGIWKIRSLDEPSEQLQLKQTEYPLRIPTATGEKRFTVNEELELSTGVPPIASVMKSCCQMGIREQKAVGGKGVFKMELLLHILYEDPKGKLCTYEWRIPISQYADLSSDVQEGDLHTVLHMTEFDLEPDSQLESHRLFLRVGIHSRSIAYETRKVQLIEDAYCTDAVLEPQWQQWQCSPLLDSRILHGTAQWSGNEPLGTLVDLWVSAEEAVKERKGDTLKISAPIVCTMLYYDGEGKLQSKQLRSAMDMELPLHEDGECVLRDIFSTEVYCNTSAGTSEIRVPLQLTVDTFGLQNFRSLKGGTLTELPMSKERRPSVILRRTEGEEDLWDIAKHYRTPVEAIREANDLTEDPIPHGTMLLIPL